MAKSRGRILVNSLTIAGVHAGYGAVLVLEDVSIQVGGGETVVLLAPTATARARS